MSALAQQLEELDGYLRCRPANAQRPSQRECLELFASLAPDALANLRSARQAGNMVITSRLLGSMSRYWWMRGLTKSVGVAEADASINLLLKSPATAYGLLGAAQIYYATANYTSAKRVLNAISDQQRGDVLNQLGMIEREQGHLQAAEKLHIQALHLYESEHDTWGQAHAISNRGVCLYRAGNIAEAVTYHEDALQRRRTLKDTLGMASSLGNLALIHQTKLKQHAKAKELYHESLSMRKALGDKWGVAGSSVSLAMVELSLGNVITAIGLVQSALDGFAGVSDPLGIAESAEASGMILESVSDVTGAAEALIYARLLRQQLGANAASVDHKIHLIAQRISAAELARIERETVAAGNMLILTLNSRLFLRSSQEYKRQSNRRMIKFILGAVIILFVPVYLLWYYFFDTETRY